jgi:hypothetical protein
VPWSGGTGDWWRCPSRRPWTWWRSASRRRSEEHGKDSVAMYGSGQWTIPDGYAASKLFKGGIGTNNVEANARLCMSSAVTGFMTSFGMDEPMGCYEDIDHADVFVLWGNNMSEMHPVLFSRMLEQRERPLGSASSIWPPAPPAPATPRTGPSSSRPRPTWPSPTPSATRSCGTGVGEPRLRGAARGLQAGPDRHRVRTRGRLLLHGRGPGRNLGRLRRFLDDYTPERVAEISGFRRTTSGGWRPCTGIRPGR